MAVLNKSQLDTKTDNVITTNGNNEITGAIENDLLKDFNDSVINRVTDKLLLNLREFVSTRPYEYGEGALYTGAIWQCSNVAGHSGVWNAANWTNISNSLSAGTINDYYRGDNTWATLVSSAVIESVNLYFTEARVRATLLTGIDTVNLLSPVISSDSVLRAIGKLQRYVNFGANADYTVDSAMATDVNSHSVYSGAILTLPDVSTLNSNVYKVQYIQAVGTGCVIKKYDGSTFKTLVADEKIIIISGINSWKVVMSSLPSSGGGAIIENVIVSGETTKGAAQDVLFNAFAAKEDVIIAGTTSQYYRGDKTWQTLVTNQATETLIGGGEIATQAEVEDEASTDDTKIVSVKKLWLALAKFFTLRKASAAEITNGASDAKLITPLGLRDSSYLTNTLDKILYNTSGTNTYVATNVSGVISSNPQQANVVISSTNTGASTINFGFGSSTLLNQSYAALQAGDLVSGRTYQIIQAAAGYVVTGVGGSTAETNTIYTTAYTVPVTLPSDKYLNFGVNVSTLVAKTFNLPASPVTGSRMYFYDMFGNAGTYNITISGNGKDILNDTTLVINSNYGSATLYYNGTLWCL